VRINQFIKKNWSWIKTVLHKGRMFRWKPTGFSARFEDSTVVLLKFHVFWDWKILQWCCWNFMCSGIGRFYSGVAEISCVLGFEDSTVVLLKFHVFWDWKILQWCCWNFMCSGIGRFYSGVAEISCVLGFEDSTVVLLKFHVFWDWKLYRGSLSLSGPSPLC